MFNPLDLTGRTIFLTGASSGIGRATAVVLSKLNARVLLTGRDEARLQETQRLMQEPERHFCFLLDFNGDEKAVFSCLRDLCEENGPLNGIVHSAGVSQTIPLKIINRAHIDSILHANVYGALALLKAASSKQILADDSAVVLLSSVASVAGFVGLSTYAASKGALNALARSASIELAPRHIRVNCLAPGLVETPMVSAAREGLPGFQQNEQRQFLGVLEPEEVAVSVAFLLSKSARHITGTTLLMDGGRSC